MPEDMVRIKTGVEMSSIANSKQEYVVEIPRSEWDALTPAQREDWLAETAQETLSNEVNAWAYVEEEG